ncbi:Protein transport protein sft2 [Savitreella phatthalungensis]
MTENAFRSQLQGWRAGTQAVPPPSAQQPSRFSRFFGTDYGRLPTHNGDVQPEEDTLSRWDRLLIFGALIAGAAVCFATAFLFLPVLALRPRKFVTLWTVGSLLFLSSWAAIQGPLAYARHLVSGPRIGFTSAYVGSLIATLYFSRVSTLLTLIAAVVQMVALLWYLVSYFPMGSTGMRFAGGLVVNRVNGFFA